MDRDNSAEFQPHAPRPCPHAAECPGCPLLGLSYADQRDHKLELVRAALSPYPELRALGVNVCAQAPEIYGYRTRAKWVASGRALGLYARGSHRVLDLPGCLVVTPAIARASAALRALLPAHALLDGLDVAQVGEKLLVTLIGAPGADETELAQLAQGLAALPELAGLAVTRREADAVQLLASGHRLHAGAGELRARVDHDGPFHYLAFGGFVQAHAQTARAIYAELARRCLALGAGAHASVFGLRAEPRASVFGSRAEPRASVFGSRAEPRASTQATEARPIRVLELYAGSGALALSLAARGLQVTAVESYAPACERIQRAAREQGLPVQVEQGDAEARVLALLAAGAHFDVVLVNPPRRGLPPALRRAIAALGARGIGYVSCRPATLARDLAHFARLGLGAGAVQPFDMMPHTEQVESLVWLVPTAGVAPEALQQGEAWFALNKAGHESVGEPRAELPRLEQRLPPAYADYRAVAELAQECSGVALFAADPQAAPRPRRRTFTVLVRGITHARGRIQGLAYVRERVVAGHSLLRVEAESVRRLCRALQGVGHPVLGDARADRAFLHLAEIELEDAHGLRTVVAPLAPDLSAVLDSLERGQERDPDA